MRDGDHDDSRRLSIPDRPGGSRHALDPVEERARLRDADHQRAIRIAFEERRLHRRGPDGIGAAPEELLEEAVDGGPARLRRRDDERRDLLPREPLGEQAGEEVPRRVAHVGSERQRDAPGQIDTHCALDAPATQFAEKAARQLGWSGRSLHRVIKLARTIADLADAARIDATHLAEAMQLRRGLPEA